MIAMQISPSVAITAPTKKTYPKLVGNANATRKNEISAAPNVAESKEPMAVRSPKNFPRLFGAIAFATNSRKTKPLRPAPDENRPYRMTEMSSSHVGSGASNVTVASPKNADARSNVAIRYNGNFLARCTTNVAAKN